MASTGDVEINVLLGWLRTFNLSTEVCGAGDANGGLCLAEALVQIEPAIFSPAWYAGLVQSKGSDQENFTSIFNLIIYYYRHNLADICVADHLPVPDLSCLDNQTITTNTLVKFLKLMLGVAVTCTNKQTFITKIQSLDETAQHALTACVASFIYTREWTGRLSQLSITPDLKVATPPGDEVWAQKCHELDFQVAMLKEERANLMAENEDLYGKVRAAQTLSRKDSVKAREFERELAHIRDEFERLRLAYEGTRTQLEAMEGRMKSSSQDNGGPCLDKLAEETSTLRTELALIRGELAGRTGGLAGGEGKAGGSDPAVAVELSEHGRQIQQINEVLHFQAGLVQEVECLKDQLDILREQTHTHRKYDQELLELKHRVSNLQLGALEGWSQENPARPGSQPVELGDQCPNRTFLSIESESCLAVSLDRLDNMESIKSTEEFSTSKELSSTSMEKNMNVDETMVLPINIQQNLSLLGEKGDKEEEEKDEGVEEKSLSQVHQSSEVVVQQTQLYQQMSKVESRLVQSSSTVRSFSEYSSDDMTDSGLEVTTSENTPFASRPESELVLPDDNRGEEEPEPNPRQLEMLLEESGASGESSPRDDRSPDKEEVIQPLELVQEEGAITGETSTVEAMSEDAADSSNLTENDAAPLSEDDPKATESDDLKGFDSQSGDEQSHSEISQRNRSSSCIEDTHRSVEEIISEIQNPELDSSLDDIQQMVDQANIIQEDERAEVECGEEGGLVAPPQDSTRISPEFTRAAGLLDGVSSPGFDPEDPAVKELEEWELRSQADKSINLEEEPGNKILGIFKSKRNSKIEERSPLMEEEEGEEEEKDKIDMSCINSWLIRILIKIFD